MNLSIMINNHLPDSVGELFALQKRLIGELKQKNDIYMAVSGELGFLEKQNNILKTQIENIYDLMDRLCSDKHFDLDAGTFGIA